MNYPTQQDEMMTQFLTGLVAGLLLGMIPLLFGYVRGRSHLGAAALMVVALIGGIWGAEAALIGAFFALAVIWGQPSKRRRIPCPYCAEMIMPDAKVCRYCGKSLVKK